MEISEWLVSLKCQDYIKSCISHPSAMASEAEQWLRKSLFFSGRLKKLFSVWAEFEVNYSSNSRDKKKRNGGEIFYISSDITLFFHKQ